MKEILPAFLMYAGDFLSDENVMAMDNRAVGVYAKLICFAWMECGVPDDPDMLRRMVKETETQWPDIWEQIKRCFSDAQALVKRGISKAQVRPGRLYLFRLETERARQEELKERYVSAGRKGGLKTQAKSQTSKNEDSQTGGKSLILNQITEIPICKGLESGLISSDAKASEVEVESESGSGIPSTSSGPSPPSIPKPPLGGTSTRVEPQDRGSPLEVLTLNTGKDYPIYQDQVKEWGRLYPAVNIGQELKNMRGWLLANPTKRKTSRGILRFINSWLAKRQDAGGGKPGSGEARLFSAKTEQNIINAQAWLEKEGVK